MKRRDMLKTSAMVASGTLLGKNILAQPNNSIVTVAEEASSYLVKRFGDARDWFFEKRFGMFVHWGLYAIPGWHEQHQNRLDVPRDEYEKLAKQWNPVDFDPEKWLDLMQEAGMQYITFTTKHHDGFCMWDTKQTAYNTMNTPYKKDILRMLADACHRRGIPLCLYYSVVDWHHPNYPNLGRHHELSGPEPGDQPDWEKYMAFLKAQVTELCTNYGEIHGFWWDMNVPEHHDPSINEMIRKLQPKAAINSRGFDEGDFGTPERDYDVKSQQARGFGRPTEACQSVGMDSWGYRKKEDYFTDRYLLKSIDSYLARDANYLLNVGPTSTGIIPEEGASILRRIGKWHGLVRESFDNVEPAPFLSSNKDILLTQRDRTVYVHVNKDPQGDRVKLEPINILPESAVLLNTGEPVECLITRDPRDKVPCLRLRGLPVNQHPNTVLVVKLEFKQLLT